MGWPAGTATMSWTMDKPTVSRWYWYKADKDVLPNHRRSSE
jgi:hypothetical protein